VKLVAGSFAWPFRGEWRSRWAAGALCVLLLPLLFIPLLGYAIQATRAAQTDPSQGPPPWRLSGRLLADGFWTSLALGLSTLPFLLLLNPLAERFFWQLGPSSDPAVSWIDAYVLAALVLALPWGLWLLLVMPHGTARLAASGQPLDLFNFPASIRAVAHDFATWNVSAAAIVTAWIIGTACTGLFCIGIIPGIFYAILVSAHAAAALTRQGPHPSTG
jgi:fucose 4-O-acetylase-like acetyltransferase